MKRFFVLIVLAAALVSCVQQKKVEEGTLLEYTLQGEECPYAEFAEYGIYVPAGWDKFNGVFILQHGCGMEQFGITRNADLQYQAFARKWGLVVIETALHGNCGVWAYLENGSDKGLFKILSKIAEDTSHPEVVDIPWLIWGHSGGGFWTLGMLRDYPERILAACCYSAAWDPQWDYTEASAKVPVILRHAGDADCCSCKETAINTAAKLRQMDGFSCSVYNGGENHNYSRLRHMMIPFFEGAMKQRLTTPGSAAMNDIDPEKAWLGNPGTFELVKESEFTGGRTAMYRFVDEEVALKWKEYATTNDVVDTTAPSAPYDVEVKRYHGGYAVVSWKAEADVESGISKFNVYVDGQLLDAWPFEGDYQTFDLNGDNTRPANPDAMEYVIANAPEGRFLVEVETINQYGLVSEKAAAKVAAAKPEKRKWDMAILYSADFAAGERPEDIVLGEAGSYTDGGLLIDNPGAKVILSRRYALAERMGRYLINPSEDAVIKFCATEEAFNSIIDIPNRTIKICSSPKELAVPAEFLEGGRDYIVEVRNEYLRSTVKVTDAETGESAVVSGLQDGCGGCGKGSLKKSFSVGMHWDGYAFSLVEGSSVLVKDMKVYSLKDDINMLLYGASISQPEGYFPARDFDRAWTQQVMAKMDYNAISCGRGGCRIDDVLAEIRNELPYIKTKYVMVTVGTNGGNTEEKLNELVDFIISCGSIPVLCNIPSNEHATQVNENELIAKVREARGLIGARYDLATSLAGDGKEVDKSMMYWEDYTDYPLPLTGWQIYHHPNELGGDAMFRQTLIDIPEIYE
ncbi:MAG: hypothetical protein MJY56_01590 [Bacteroidales bacterium]|nr:hypothetical protein [Bacteroidales bacterium]